MFYFRSFFRFAGLLGVCAALSAQPGLAQQVSQRDGIQGQITALNRELARPAGGRVDESRTNRLLDRRGALLHQLISIDPAGALSLSLPGEEVEWEGTVKAIIQDDFANRQSRTNWYLRTAEGTFQMFFAGIAPRVPGAVLRIRGLRASNRIAVANIMREAAAPAREVTAFQGCTTTGPQSIAVLMVTTPGSPTFPPAFTMPYLQQEFFGTSSGSLNTDSLNHFWLETSYGLASATGQVFGPFALSQDYTDDQAIAQAAVNAADFSVDFTKFTRVALVIADPVCSGVATLGCDVINSPSRGRINASTAWIRVCPSQSPSDLIGTIAHELGHNLGLHHANSDAFSNAALGPLDDPGTSVEYGDPFSAMGAGESLSGQAIAGQYSAEHKGHLLQWLTPGSGFQEVQTSGTFTLPPFEASSGVRALRILRDAASAEWLWAEYRQPIGDIDSSLSLYQSLGGTNGFSGAILHRESPLLDPLHTYLLTSNPTAIDPANPLLQASFLNGALTPGHSWSDPYSLLSLGVNGATASGLSLSVTYDQPCAALHSSTTVLPFSGGAGTISVSASPGCAWTATTASAWITINGPASGQGSGTVSFSMAPNSGAQQRKGSIAIQRQTIGVVQSGTGVSVLRASPNSGSGSTQQFTFVFSDPRGFADISQAEISFDDYGGTYSNRVPECGITVTAAGFVSLSLDQGQSPLQPLPLSAKGSSIANNECTVYATGSSIAGSGNQLSITLQITFSRSFAGTHRMNGLAFDRSNNDSGTLALGSWRVQAGSLSSSVAPALGSGSSQALTFTYSDPNGYQDISGSQIVVNSTVTAGNGCYILFGRGSNQLSLADDTGQQFSSTTIGTPAVLQNSQCSVIAFLSSQVTSGNTLTLRLYVVFKPSFAGPKNVYTKLDAVSSDTSGYQQVGTFTATASAGSVQVASVSPSAGSGNAQAFTFTYADPNGYPDLAGAQVVFNSTLTAGNGCYILFGRGNSLVSLADDSGRNFSSAVLGAQTVLQNSQCTLYIGNSYQQGSGLNLSLTLFLAFKSVFAGTKTVYSQVNDNAGHATGYSNLGSWTVLASGALGLTGVNPSGASGISQAFSFSYYDPNGFSDISGSQVLINGGPSVANGCNIVFNRATNQISLADDAGANPRPATLGSASIVQNSQCTVNAAASYQFGAGNVLTLTLYLTFQPGFSGTKTLFTKVDTVSGATAGLQTAGTWTVTSPTLFSSVSVTPNAGQGSAQAFTFTFGAPNGFADISGGQLVFSPSLVAPNSCYVLFGRGSNLITLADNTGSGFTSAVLGNSYMLSNSQCSVDASKSFQYGTGNVVNLTVFVTFNPSYSGLKYTFSKVDDNAGNTAGWQVLGSWQAQ